MKKAEIIERIVSETGISRKAAEVALDVAIDSVKNALSRGESVTIPGFGTFKSTERVSHFHEGMSPPDKRENRRLKSPTFSASRVLENKISRSPTGGGGPGKKR